MTPRPPVAARALAILGLSFAVTLGGGFANTESMVEHSFAEALSAPGRTGSDLAAAPIAGSEEFWLAKSRLGADPALGVETAAWSPPVARGDQISVGDGSARQTLEVVSVEAAQPNVTRIDTGLSAARKFIVTCRVAGGGDDRLVRVVLDGAPGSAANSTLASGRTL